MKVSVKDIESMLREAGHIPATGETQEKNHVD